jgi:large subunit ribosomal protein L17
MRHKTKRHILGVSSSHRSALMGNLSVALIEHGRIKTTLAKAKALRPFIEKIVTFAKKAEAANDPARKLHFRRLAISRVRDKEAVAKLFDERVSEFTSRNGGYTRIIKLGTRIGDAAEMALIEFLEASDEGYAKPKKASGRKAAAKKAAPAAEVEEAAADEASVAESEEAAVAEEATEEATEAVEAEVTQKATEEAPAEAAEGEANSDKK